MTVRPLRHLGVAKVARAGEWWEFKLVPALAAAYATALMLDVPIVSLGRTILVLLFALASGAVFVSLLNDATDRADDAAAGKPNRLAGRSKAFIATALTASILPGVVIGWWWRADAALLAAYAGAWIAFAAYSLPPFRLKQRGAWGLLADAAGAHLFPALMAVLSIFAVTDRAPDPIWLGAIGVWALSFGARGILWHQMADAENDRSTGVRTFVVQTSPRTALRLARYLVFPAESAALAVLLWRLGEPAPLMGLVVYAVLVIGRVVYFQQFPVIVESRPRYLILLHEYYGVLLPVSLLLTSASHEGRDWLALVAHCALFPRAILATTSDSLRITYRCFRGYRLK